MSAATITPKSIISYPLQPSTTPTIFFPISCTSPFTVANNILAGPLLAPFGLIEANFFLSFSASIKGVNTATLFFITLALFTTCGKNIFPAPNKSPTWFMPAMSGPSMTSKGSLYCNLASSVSASIKSVIPLIKECANLSSTVPSLHAALFTSTLPFAFTVSAYSIKASVASLLSLFLLRITSSHKFLKVGSISS